MDKKVLSRWDQPEVRAAIQQAFAKHPESYLEVVKAVVQALTCNDLRLDPERIHEIDDGSYQGTLVYVIAETGYQPSDYWYVLVSYGSCSGCDTIHAIREYSDDPPNEQQVKDYMTLALHIAQGLKRMGSDRV